MCGINGVFHYHGSAKKEGELKKMNQVLAYRGPDAEGVFEDQQIELGHRRLSIIDLSESANQPIISSDGNWVIVFNGEIYNYADIKKQLPEYPFKTQGDTEVVLAAFQKWGEHSLRLLNGIFSFAIWNKITKQLFIARDRLGVKPLYYFSSNEVFMFSSSIKAILSTGRSKNKISKSGLVDFLRYQTVHAPATIISDIYVLMPGTFAYISEEENFQPEQYWSLTNSTKKSSNNKLEIIKTVREQVEKSVSMQLVSDAPFGAFLSGGIDSSILVGVMASQRSQPVDTFSVVFKEDKFSEGKYAELVAKKFNTRHHEIELSVEAFRDLIPEALTSMDHPSGDGPNTYVVSKKTHDAGIKMALTGLGGDELFCGYSIFNQIKQISSKKWLRSFPVYARRPLASMYRNLKGTVAADKIASVMSLAEFDTENIYEYYRRVFNEKQIQHLLKNNDKVPVSVFHLVKEQVGYNQPGWNLPLMSRVSVAEMSTYMQNVLLRDADQMGMANSLELRVPFLDHELVELALGISDGLKSGGIPKKLLVESFQDILPQEVWNREKMGFVLPYEIWMKNDLKTFCEERLNWLGNTPYFNEQTLTKYWNLFLNGNKMVTWSRIWTLVVLSNWMKENNVN
ncbi:MAG: asparagine synthase (glutamine-hydrolyzing) [Crocinitomicaceae bacterium]|nr:asparagine synthase (glutamine-hydrolyzing) [Crocinitomicaceae bacterium]